MARALISLPESAGAGEVIEVKVLIQHPMETGYRPGPNGQLLPRDIIRRFVCRYDGVEVFSADLHPAMAANPFIAFHTVAVASGEITFTWTGDNGFEQTERRSLKVA